MNGKIKPKFATSFEGTKLTLKIIKCSRFMGVAAAAMRMSVQYGNSQAVYSESRHTSALLLCVNLFTLLAIES